MIQLFKIYMIENIGNEINKVLLSGKISQYDKVDQFEKLLSKYIGNSKLITLNTGTNALHLAYYLLRKPIPELSKLVFSFLRR